MPAPLERKPEDAQGPMKYDDENEEILFGPTTRPNEPMGINIPRAVKRPKDLGIFLPTLTAIADSPDAPQELHDFLRMLQYHAGG